MQNNSNNYLSVDSHFIPNETIILEPAEASKFSYIIGWVIYKLTKSDNIMKSHPKFEAMCAHLKVLSSEQIVYEQDVRSQITNVIPGQDFLDIMYKLESLVLLLFEKYKELGPNILLYIHNNLLCNLFLWKSFITIFNISGQILYTHNPTNTEKHELTEETKKFLYERIISIYMRSRQKSWRRFNELTPEKGTSSLRENLKAMKNDIKKIDNKPALIKKSNIPKDPMLGLEQIRIWAHLENVENEFSKIFLMNELKWLLWAFGDNSKNKKKKDLIPLILDHLKKGTPFSEEALAKGHIFVY
ncbi:5829_t:CDS:1 [Diversispora eburnea]|uniref:5829_t:CDS:1 n=1 Tax=Diversispora eburnea TaxID=1213867 RepID=A0A9N9GIY9_9GLOM|nr:5829_t:CDS:1 [Diversispora eburnea]